MLFIKALYSEGRAQRVPATGDKRRHHPGLGTRSAGRHATPMAGNQLLGEDPRLQSLIQSGLVCPPQAPIPGDFLDRPRPADREGRLLEAVLQERAEGR